MTNGTNRRDQLLLKMYDQLCTEINTHILVVWQSIGVLIGAFAFLALVEKKIISIDLGTTLILILCGWLFANVLDTGYWYNRNLAMITNIERQFLEKTDLQEIHYYFGKHRQNKMIAHLRIQFALGLAIGGVVLLFHFSTRVLKGFSSPWSSFELQRTLPYLVSIAVAIYVILFGKKCDRKYAEFIKNSPGKPLDSSNVLYGEGHGFPRTEETKNEEE